MHHSSSAANYNNISSKFQLQLKISKRMYCLSSVNCHGGWDKTMQAMFARSNGQEGQSVGKGSSSENTY